MRSKEFMLPVLSLLAGFVGAAFFQLFAVGMNVDAEESTRHLTLDSLSVKQLVLFNGKNETVAKLHTDSYGLPAFHLGRSERGHIDFKFVSENQPAITVTGGMGRSFSMLGVKNLGTNWEPVLTLGHKDERVGLHLSIFKEAGNIMLTNNYGGILKFDASQGAAWRRMSLTPLPGAKIPGLKSGRSTKGTRYSNIKAR